jgi:hypothetical protein
MGKQRREQVYPYGYFATDSDYLSSYQEFSYDTVFDGSEFAQFVGTDSNGQPLFLQIIGAGNFQITNISVTAVQARTINFVGAEEH